MRHVKNKILIVDDDPGTREMLRLGLEQQGYAVLEADSGKKVMEILDQPRAQLVILDILMEEKEGIETLRDIRMSYPTIPVIMISSDSFYLTLSLKMGANEALEKPIDLRELYRLADDYLQKL